MLKVFFSLSHNLAYKLILPSKILFYDLICKNDLVHGQQDIRYNQEEFSEEEH